MWRLATTVFIVTIALPANASAPKYRLVSYPLPKAPVDIVFAETGGTIADGRSICYGLENNDNFTRHYFFQKGNEAEFINLPGSFNSFVMNGFAQNGDICGRISKDGTNKAVVAVDGSFTELPGNGRTIAYRLNSSGLVAGFQIDDLGTRPVLWRNGVQTILGRDGFLAGAAESVTESGVVYGTLAESGQWLNPRVARWDEGQVSYPFGKETIGRNVVCSLGGTIAAVTKSPGDIVRPRRMINGQIEDLPAPSWRLDWETRSVNDAGDIVGFGYDASQANPEFESFLWKGSEMYGADSLLQPDQSHIKIKALNHINNAGEISGLFLNTRTGLHEPGLLVPVPEPSLLGLSVGFALLAFRRCRRSST